MRDKNGELRCDMRSTCTREITHLGEKGFIYCREHAKWRRDFERCRPLSPDELRQLQGGVPLSSY